MVSINDYLVKKFLENKISYTSIQKIMLKLIKSRYFSNYYNLSPNNINEIKIMVKKVNLYLDEYLKK